MLKIIFLIIQLSFVFYFILILFLYLFQNKMIFSPYQKIVGTPSELGLEFEDVNLKSQDGASINGWFIPAKNTEYTILFCHGNGGNISHRLDTISLFNKLPVNFFLFDYQTYGKSQGSISEKGLYKDVAAAWDYLTKEKKILAKKIIIVGRSLGGSIAAHAAAEFSPGGLVLESTFTSLPEIAVERLPIVPVSWFLNYKLSTIENLTKVKCPVLIFASPDDSIVSYRHGKKLFKKALEPKAFVELTGDHDDCYFLCRTKYVAALTNFLKTCF